ncbi:MAG: hypothetical protein R3179_02520 [Sedimenticolaceae bacterium]|nr:hypothetical protein [Sedimenticolaceae bacterium]
MNSQGNAHFSAIAEPACTRMSIDAAMCPVRARRSPARTIEAEFQEAPI